MSLHTIVNGGLGGRLHLRRGVATVEAEPRMTDMAISLPGGSMRWLETVMALIAIGTAILIGGAGH